MNFLLSRCLPLFCSLIFVAGCGLNHSSPSKGPIELTVLYTNDEHGWMEGVEAGRGAANLYRLWQAREGLDEDGAFLVLSGGDNWTGPAISTWVEGKSMVQLMNAMDYDASAVGNHEFDFGLAALSSRIKEAEFPYLSANTQWKDSGGYALDLGILPFTIKTVADIDIAIIGLTTTSTSRTTMPSVVAPLNFVNYEFALRKVMPQVRKAEPDLVIVIGHVCMDELRPLAANVVDLNIALMGGGHCNELTAEKLGDTVILGGGYHFTSYAKAVISYDPGTQTPSTVSYSTHENVNHTADPEIDAIVSLWRSVSEETLSENLGFSAGEWAASSPELKSAIVGSWLDFDRTADIAITNGGGIRAALTAGEINLGAVVAMLPFANTIIATQLSGAQIRQILADANRPVIAGIKLTDDGDWVLNRTGMLLVDTDSYRVLVNSFMYDGGDGYELIAEFDPDGFDTAVNYREPFVQWLKKMNSSHSQPLQLN